MNFNNPQSRLDCLKQTGMGMGMLGLAGGLPQALADGYNLKAKPSMYAPKAKRVIHIFLNGGLSHVDSFDPKPELDKYHGKELYIKYQTERKTGTGMRSPFKFKQYGQSGLPISELFSELGDVADDLCYVRSMTTNVPQHERSMLMMSCGEGTLSRPSVGSWATYGLGSVNENLPGFISMVPKGKPTCGQKAWQSAFLPSIYQATHINTETSYSNAMIPNLRNSHIGPKYQAEQLELLRKINEKHLKKRPENNHLDARIQSFELAYNMQMAGTDAFDLSSEPEHIREMYGEYVQSKQLLMARRLLERGVRFIQVWHGPGQPWDSHSQIEKEHRKLAGEISPGIGALIKDLKQRGMLEDTLVVICGEFGRTPTVELAKASAGPDFDLGRDHNHKGFTVVLAGGGVKGGHVFGATDEFGFGAVENPVHVHDLHATMLHLMGCDHEKLTYRYAGRDFRLTDVHGEIMHDIIA